MSRGRRQSNRQIAGVGWRLVGAGIYSYNVATLRSDRQSSTAITILLSRIFRCGTTISIIAWIGYLYRRLCQHAPTITIGHVREIRDHARLVEVRQIGTRRALRQMHVWFFGRPAHACRDNWLTRKDQTKANDETDCAPNRRNVSDITRISHTARNRHQTGT